MRDIQLILKVFYCLEGGLGDLRNLVMLEAHKAPYSAHPGVKKMYANLKQHYFWPGMKRDIADFVARCLECQWVKGEHQHPTGHHFYRFYY